MISNLNIKLISLILVTLFHHRKVLNHILLHFKNIFWKLNKAVWEVIQIFNYMYQHSPHDEHLWLKISKTLFGPGNFSVFI